MYNVKPKNVAEIQHRLRQIDITVGAIRALVSEIITPLSPKALQMLNRGEVVAIPVLRTSTLTLLDQCKNDLEGDILLAMLNELGLCYGLDIDLIEILDDSKTIRYIMLLSFYEDPKPDGDDDPDDDDDPKAEIEEPQKTMAMSAGAGKLN